MSRQKRTRRNFSAEQKADILRRHLVDKIAISDLCDKHQIQPSLFYLWQRQAFENLSKAIEPSVDRYAAQRQAAQEQKVAVLEARLAKKDSVIAEISAEYVALKKELGEL
jgi:transposase